MQARGQGIPFGQPRRHFFIFAFASTLIFPLALSFVFTLGPFSLAAAIIVAIVLIALFNAFRPPLVIVLTVPFAIIGISAGLLITDTPFGFMALLGGMSLAGMMIKNSIVLLEEVDLNLERGLDRYKAVVEAAVSRLRPVALAAATNDPLGQQLRTR